MPFVILSLDGLDSDTNDESAQEIDIEMWSKSPEVIGCFQCQEIKDDGYMCPRSPLLSFHYLMSFVCNLLINSFILPFNRYLILLFF